MRHAWVLGWALALAACAAATKVAAPDPLAGSEWAPTRLGETAANVQVEQFVRFESQGRVVGAGGCNRFTGGYAVAGSGAIEIGPLAATRMACASLPMELEQAFLSALERTSTFRRDGAVLALFAEDGTEVATFSQRDAD